MAFTGAWGQWYEESEHPRGQGGKWTSKGGGGQGGRQRSVGETALPKPSARELSAQDLEAYEPDWSRVRYGGAAQHAVIAWLSLYDDINKALRAGDGRDQQDTILGLDRAFDGAPVLDEDIVVYRGMGIKHRRGATLDVGTSWVDPGFVATSSKDWAKPFAERGGVLMQITVPKGTRVMTPMVSKLNPEARRLLAKEGITDSEEQELAGVGAEPELLLNRGTRFTVTGKVDNVLQVMVGEGDVVPTDEPEDGEQPTEDKSGLRNYLQIMSKFQEQQSPGTRNPANFMLEHGQEFSFDESSYKGKRGKVHQCFSNSGERALADPNVTYVEGYVSVHGVPLEHAWLVDKQGHVIDPTIKNGDGIGGYFGIPIKSSYLQKTIMRTKRWGVLDWMNLAQVMKDDPNDIVADYTKGGGAKNFYTDLEIAGRPRGVQEVEGELSESQEALERGEDVEDVRPDSTLMMGITSGALKGAAVEKVNGMTFLTSEKVQKRQAKRFKDVIAKLPARHIELLKDIPIRILQSAKDLERSGNAGLPGDVAGLFSWTWGNPKTGTGKQTNPRITMVTHQWGTNKTSSGKVYDYFLPMPDFEHNLAHEIGHAIDFKNGWKLGQMLDKTFQKEWSNADTREQFNGFLFHNAPIRKELMKERFAELYALAYNPNVSGRSRYFGGMKRARAMALLPTSILLLKELIAVGEGRKRASK